jgi:superfamily II DNA or RNA helicase
MSDPRGWNQFVMRASQSSAGVRALKAYRRQRELSLAAAEKARAPRSATALHRKDRVLVFTQDNATAYAGRQALPFAHHHAPNEVKERSEILERFSDGRYGAVVTSKVLNEGVDVPDANVAVVISGSGSVREHVQRLGRVLGGATASRPCSTSSCRPARANRARAIGRRAHSAYQ